MHRVQHLDLFRAHGARPEAGWRLHRNQRHELEQVVRHHVAQCTGRFIEVAAMLDADRFGNRDLDVVDVIAVPEGLENPVGEPEHHDVPNRLLSKIVVDAVNLILVQYAEDLLIQCLC